MPVPKRGQQITNVSTMLISTVKGNLVMANSRWMINYYDIPIQDSFALIVKGLYQTSSIH